MKRLLFVTPKPECPTITELAAILSGSGFSVVCVSFNSSMDDAARALHCAFGGCSPDLILADLSGTSTLLPLHFARRMLNTEWPTALPPICLVLATPELILNPEFPAMADDFVLPPFMAAEITARFTQLLFRKRHISTAGTLTFADVCLDMSGREARDRDGCKLVLTPREYDLLEFLLIHRGKLFGRDRLLDLVWGIDFEGGERTVDVHVRRLRAKLPALSASLLKTSRGFGYGFRMA